MRTWRRAVLAARIQQHVERLLVVHAPAHGVPRVLFGGVREEVGPGGQESARARRVADARQPRVPSAEPAAGQCGLTSALMAGRRGECKERKRQRWHPPVNQHCSAVLPAPAPALPLLEGDRTRCCWVSGRSAPSRPWAGPPPPHGSGSRGCRTSQPPGAAPGRPLASAATPGRHQLRRGPAGAGGAPAAAAQTLPEERA